MTSVLSLSTNDPALTTRVIDSFNGAVDDRFRQIMTSLVAHLHSFASEVRLTDDEWAVAVDYLTRMGQISDDARQETILMSDVLGLSMLVVGLNHPADAPVTESTVFGPFFTTGSPEFVNGDDISGSAVGQPCYFRGTVTDESGAAISGALLEVWHSDEDGNYDVQYADLEAPQGRGHLHSDEEGRYWFWSILPEPYPIPEDGPVGQLLHAAQRSPWRPAHVHFMISAPGYATLVTHVFREGDSYLGIDAVFGEKDGLVQEFVLHQPGTGPADRGVNQPYFSMAFAFVLAKDESQPGVGDDR